MTSRATDAIRSVGRVARRPVELARTAWSRKLETATRIVSITPRPIRRVVARPIAAVAEPLALRRPGSARLPPLAFLARWAAGPPARTTKLGERLGTSDRTDMRARRQLVRLAIACKRKDLAARILDTLPDEPFRDLDQARASIELTRGQYTQALGHAERAIASGRRTAAGTAKVLRARLAVLDPDWVPDLGSRRVALERLRGLGTPGRVLHVVSVSLPYRQAGYTLRSQSIAHCQQAVGLDPHFATRGAFPSNKGVRKAPLSEVVDGVPYYRLAPDFPKETLHDQLVTESAVRAADLMVQLRPAVLHPASNHLQAQIALAVGRPAGVPVVYEVRGFLEETWASMPRHDEVEAQQTDRYRLNRAAETRAMVAADAVVTLSETMRSEIVSRGCEPDKVVVVPNAVDIDRFRPVARDDRLASSLGIDPGDPVVGYISSMTAYEGIHFLLDAAAELRAAGRRLRVLLVGDGAEVETLERRGRRLGLDDGTLLMPGRVPHEDILNYYSILDIFVVPRTNDRVSRLVTPLKPYEAMAMERALVVSDVPALREIVTPGETGMTFRAENAGDLAAVLAGLIDDPALRQRLGRQAREWVAEHRTWTRNGRIYRELYERLGAV